MIFEIYDVPAWYIQNHATLSLYKSGKTTGLVVESGDGVTFTVPVFEGYQIPDAIQRSMFSGRDLTAYMQKILKENHYYFDKASNIEINIVKDMKEKTCFISQNYEEDL